MQKANKQKNKKGTQTETLTKINPKSISDLKCETQNYQSRGYHRRNLHDLGMAMTSQKHQNHDA